MNQTDTQKALDDSRALRGTLEETRQLIEIFKATRQHFAVLADDMAYRLDVLQERVEMQSVALGLIERLLRQHF
jgi:hypothetical protein